MVFEDMDSGRERIRLKEREVIWQTDADQLWLSFGFFDLIVLMLFEKALLYLLIMLLRWVCIYSASPLVIYGYVLLPSKIQVLSVEMSWWTPNRMSYLANIFKNCVEWTICYQGSFLPISSALVGMRLKITYKSLDWLTSILVCVCPRYHNPVITKL